jgi:hypothetical protein
VQQNKEVWFDFARHLSKFDGVLFFLNANFAGLIHFYIYKLHKTLEGSKICLMFTKSNIALSKMDSGSTSLTIYGRRKTDDGKQRVEDRRRITENRRRKTDGKRRMLDAKG